MGFLRRLFSVSGTPPDSARKLGRNAKCWCGSGQKYKHCHLESDKRYFSSKLASTCKTSSG